jgi:ATP phosphoribosyltransferase
MEKFVLGIPTGRLEMFCLSQLKSIGIEIKDSPQINRKYRIAVRHSLITDVLFVKPADICPAIHEGMLDVGFSGSDCYDEFHLRTGKHLYFSEKEKTTDNENCSSRICLIGSVGVTEFNKKVVTELVTDYPNYASLCFPKASITAVNGSLEGLIPHPFDYGITVVETGETLLANNLKVITTLRYNYVRFYFARKYLLDRVGSCHQVLEDNFGAIMKSHKKIY